MTDTTEKKQFRVLEKPRQVHNADVLFDSNVIRANSPLAERTLFGLTDLLVEYPDQGDIWFSLLSLYEMLAPRKPARQIAVLTAFQNLYRRFGERVKFFGPGRFSSIRCEWESAGRVQSAPANAIDKLVSDSIAKGELVAELKAAREDWEAAKAELRKEHDAKVARCRAEYESNPVFRDEIKESLVQFGTEKALDQCDDVVSRLLVNVLNRPADDVRLAKERPSSFNCTWTYALLTRLADFSATLTEEEREKNFKRYGRLLEFDQNDFIDAYVASFGGKCGMLITDDEGLIRKLNAIHDAHPSIVRLQGFTVEDAFIAYNPPNGRKRDRTKQNP
ncbi:hypothetical protein [Myxococcus sp. RHSTA-1-4]|uniref:hypothetical protein n=1 Tax=Myxococcus sp. RHSTA-1-4 TaxID=2874601 RepID=UPI001CBC876A|nr:hypothetical protein [Myxococcus sp. RHSTA-1-4]MBZ4423336.1 hypothetical protein [Myxococcus sp. RHSTA-1-4]